MIKILIVEDEKPISDLIRLSLGKSGYDCDCAFDGMSAADMLDENIYDLVLLDIMPPEVDGFELLEYIKPLCIPVIFITAKGSVTDRVRGLRMGAEDYIVKPFEVLELQARVDVVLRRYNKTESVISIGGLTIDTNAMQVIRSGEIVGRRLYMRLKNRRYPCSAHAQKGRLGAQARCRKQGRLPPGGLE